MKLSVAFSFQSRSHVKINKRGRSMLRYSPRTPNDLPPMPMARVSQLPPGRRSDGNGLGEKTAEPFRLYGFYG
jgi:hypothetical protein